MAPSNDYYKALGVAKTATEDEIKQAYRKLARELHPDVNKAPDAAARFQEVQDAYEVLSDSAKRAAYDRGGQRRARPSASPRSGTYTWSNIGGTPGEGGFDDVDLSDIFEEMFGGSGGAGVGGGGGGPFGTAGRAAGARSRSHPVRGRDITREIAVPFITAARGGVESIRIVRGGRPQTIDVTIPKGTKQGAKLRIAGAGSPSPGSGQPGDLILTVSIGEHPYFKRDGAGLDLTIDVPITIAEAALGATVTIPTLDAARIELTIPPGSSSGKQLRIRGRGLTDDSGNTGDLRAIIRIVAPADLSAADREALAALDKRLPSPRSGSPWDDR